jgi:hypothetical protein
MPWQPSHIRVISRPFAASPADGAAAGAGVWAVAAAHAARIEANRTDRIIGGLSLRSRKVGQLLAAQNHGF